jgi:hypothetical protein
VGDRSFLTEIVALFLAISLAWPSSGYTRVGQAPSTSVVPVVTSSEGHSLIRARSQGLETVPERHASKLRGVLDDDPAMLSDDSEDWIEDSTGLTAAYPAAPAHGSFFMVASLLGVNAGPPQTPPIHLLCRYQC